MPLWVSQRLPTNASPDSWWLNASVNLKVGSSYQISAMEANPIDENEWCESQAFSQFATIECIGDPQK
jgi:hypothetical protein